MADKYKIKFQPPESYTPPDDKRAGETFDATVQLRIEDDGQLCILTLDGVPMTEETETEDVEVEEKASQPSSMAEAASQTRAMGYAI